MLAKVNVYQNGRKVFINLAPLHHGVIYQLHVNVAQFPVAMKQKILKHKQNIGYIHIPALHPYIRKMQ